MDKAIFTAIAHYNKTLKEDQGARVYAPLCEAYRKVGLLDDAVRVGERGLELFPSYLACREALGNAYFKRGDIERAAEHLEPVARVVRDNLQVRKLLAKIHLAKGQAQQAEQLLELVSSRDPLDFEARALLVSTRQRLRGEEHRAGSDEPALDAFGDEPELPPIDIGQIEIYQPEQYVKATDQALGDLEGLEGQLDRVADRLVDGEVDDPRLRLKKIRRRIETAEEARSKQVEIKAAAHLAQVHMELSLLDEAINTSRKLLKDDPKNSEIQEMLQRFEELLGAKERECDRLEQLDDLTTAISV